MMQVFVARYVVGEICQSHFVSVGEKIPSLKNTVRRKSQTAVDCQTQNMDTGVIAVLHWLPNA